VLPCRRVIQRAKRVSITAQITGTAVMKATSIAV
jgi:hypothetical protein